MAEVVSRPLSKARARLAFAATVLIAATCLRVALGPTPIAWLHVLAPMFLLTALTLCLAQAPVAGSLLRMESIALLSTIYIMSAAAIAEISLWHWSDQIGLAAFCLITVLIGFEQSSRDHAQLT